MKTVELAPGRMTSQLGFGGTILIGGGYRAENLRILHAAYDAGFRHFDVAPSYGLGVAEGVLGEFIESRRDTLTVTTKVGLSRPSNPGLMARVRGIAKKLLSSNPALRKKLGGAVYKASVQWGQFEIEKITASFASSLKELRTDRVDALLLHELRLENVNEDLRAWVAAQIAAGAVGATGFGSPRAEAERLIEGAPDLADIVQTGWSVGDAPFKPARPRVLITHGALRKMEVIEAWLAAEPGRAKALSDSVGDDLSSRGVLAELLVAAALAHNDKGIVMIRSGQPARLQRYVALCSDKARLAQGAELAKLLEGKLPA